MTVHDFVSVQYTIINDGGHNTKHIDMTGLTTGNQTYRKTVRGNGTRVPPAFG